MTKKNALKIVSKINDNEKNQFRRFVESNKLEKNFISNYQYNIDELSLKRFGFSICAIGSAVFTAVALLLAIFNVSFIFPSISNYIVGCLCAGMTALDLHYVSQANKEMKNEYKKLFGNSNLSRKKIEALALTGQLTNIVADLDLDFAPKPFAEFDEKADEAEKENLINRLRLQLAKIADEKKENTNKEKSHSESNTADKQLADITNENANEEDAYQK